MPRAGAERTRKHGPRAGSAAGWQTAPMKSTIVELGRMPTRELPRYWRPEQLWQILAAMPASQPWLLALLTS